jgi:hypothetical protein
MKAVAVGLAVTVLAAGATWPASTRADETRPNAVTAWEYRVVSKDQLLEWGKKDLAAGLNKLGNEGWELVVVDGGYIFKRPKEQLQRAAAEVKRRIALIESDVEAWKERVAWAERMVKRGYMTERQVNSERLRLREAESALESARDELKALPAEAQRPPEKLPMPGK